MILKKLLYKGLWHIAPHTTEVPRSTCRMLSNFYQTFYQKWTTFDKNYQKDNLWGSFLLVRTID